jgi:methionyl-tRNA formyltransferase
MSNATVTTDTPRVLFLGMQGNFSTPSLHALLAQHIDVAAVVVPARWVDSNQPAIRQLSVPQKSRLLLPLVNSSLHTSIIDVARERNIPVWEVQCMNDPETISVFSRFQPDIICVACFSHYIPPAILDIPRLGCLNVHPSLLPANRGPDPLFWTFRNGDEQAGVTIHLMNEKLDSGPIVAQMQIMVPDGISYPQLESRCAVLGGNLLAQAVWNLYRGTAGPKLQDEAASSYHPMPTADDFIVPVEEWSARHVYNFIRGISSWGIPIYLSLQGNLLPVSQVISYSHKNIETSIRIEGQVTNHSDSERVVKCKEGWVSVILAEK